MLSTAPSGPGEEARPASTSDPRALEAALVAVAALLVALVPAFTEPVTGLRLGLVVAGVLGLAAGWFLPDRTLPGVTLALIPASLVISSQIAPFDGRYLPMGALAAALLVAVARRVWQRQVTLRVPTPAVAATLAAYLAWAAVTTATSTDRGTSLVYLAGIAGSFVVAFVLVPTVLSRPADGRWLLGMLAVAGVVIALSAGLLALTGPLRLGDRWLGLFEIAQLTIRGAATGIVIPRATGPFLVPADMGIALGVALVALLGIRRPLRTRAGLLDVAGLAIVGLALLVTMGRNGWLVGAVGTGGYALATLLRRRLDGVAVVVSAALLAALAALTLNLVGANLRYDLAVARYGPELAALLPGASDRISPEGADSEGFSFRGGSDLSSRPILWKASADAIRARPLFGSGPGTNPDAIAGYLTGEDVRLRGLLSHNSWLRTGVEMGLPGLLAFIAFVVVAGLTMLRRAAGSANRADDPERLALLAIFPAIVAGQTFASFILGGLSYPSFTWILAAGALVSVSWLTAVARASRPTTEVPT